MKPHIIGSRLRVALSRVAAAFDLLKSQRLFVSQRLNNVQTSSSKLSAITGDMRLVPRPYNPPHTPATPPGRPAPGPNMLNST